METTNTLNTIPITKESMSISNLAIMTKALGKGKRIASSKYKFDCPNCRSEKTLHVDPEKSGGPCICTSCGYRTNVVSIAKTINETVVYSKEVEERVVDWDLLTDVYTTAVKIGTIRDAHIEWARKRGIVVNTTREPNKNSMILRSSDMLLNNLQEIYTQKQLEEAGLLIEKNGMYYNSGLLYPNKIVIPYFNYKGICVYIRSRAINSAETIRYMSPSGVPGRQFSWGWDTFIENEEYLIITEGEFKAQAAKQLGFNCIALSGMQTGQKEVAIECSKRKVSKVYIMFDTETEVTSNGIPKQNAVNSAVNRLAELLLRYRIRPYKSSLPSLGQSKMDIDTFVLISGNNAKENLLEVLKASVPFNG
jgi:Zn ribbon nucleic-acid-binding protein